MRHCSSSRVLLLALDSISAVAVAHLPLRQESSSHDSSSRAANNGATEEVDFYADHIDSYMSIGMMTAYGAINGFRIAWRRSALLVAPTITPELKKCWEGF